MPEPPRGVCGVQINWQGKEGKAGMLCAGLPGWNDPPLPPKAHKGALYGRA